MKKHLTSFFLLSILFAISSLHFAYGQTSIKLPHKETLQNKSNEPKYYAIDLTNMPQNMDIALSSVYPTVTANKDSNTARLFVSKTKEKPSNTQESDFHSTNSNGNVIFISREELKEVKTLYVGVQCGSSRCNSKLIFEYTKELNMEANGERQVETAASLGQVSSAIVRLRIPNIENAERIVIHADALPSTNTETPELNMFFNRGKSIPYTGRTDEIKRTAWFEGRTLVINKGTNLFCTDCDYTISLQFNEGASISFEARVYQTETKLGGYPMLDGVQLNRGNLYTLKVEEERKNEDIVIDLRAQEGSPIIYINCDTKPTDVAGYYWKYHIDKSQEIIMTARERQQCKTNTLYVLVYGDEVAVYSIRAVVKKASKLFVDKDSQVLGDIFPNEKITYEIFMPLFAANKIVIRLDTKGKIGTSIINCRFPTDCPGLLPSDIEYKHPEDDFMDWSVGDFDYETKQTETGKEFIIDPHSKGCYPILIEDPLYMEDALPVCAYQITLSSSESFPQEYTLAADSEGHQWLFPGIPKSSAVFEKEKEHFVVNVPPHRDVKSVNFQLTEFSGDVVIYISRTEMYPNEKTDDTKFAHEGMIMFTNSSSLDGTYYITVEGLTTSSFGITCNIIGFNDEQEDYALTLEAGVPQRGVLLPNQEHPAQFYKFKLNVDEKWVGTIKIAVSTLRGNVLVGVNNNGNMPLPNVHTWKSYGRDLEIASDDPNFKRKGTYHIGVFVDWTKLKLGDIVFTISYSIKEKNNEGEKPYLQQHQFVSPLTPFYGTIRKGEVEFFEAFVLPKDKKITVYKQADVGDVDIFLTTDPDNLYPTVSSYTYTTKNTFRDYIELTESDFTKICKGVEDTICSFFFSVLPKGDQAETPYSISMSREYKQAEKEGEDRITWVPLEDGRQIKTDVPVSGSSNFYFYTTPYNPGVVTVSCPGKIISIYAAKTKVEIGISAKPEIKAVTSENYEYSSFDTGTASVGISSLTIPAYENEDTNIVSVAVYFFDVDSTAADNSRFTILASTEMTYIYTGRPYYGTVQENKYMYFFFDVYKDSTTLLISLTTLDDGDPDLVVSTGYDSRPTLESHQFASVSLQRTELLEINDLDIYPLNSMANTWVVGVYGRKASTFTLTVLYEDQKTVELTQGQPFEMYTREESKMFFKYYQSRSSDLEIKIDQLSGSMEAYISTMKGDGDLVSNLPNETNYSWKISPSYNPVINIPSTDPKTCHNCVFLITLKSSEASKLSIIITEGNKFAQVQNGMTYSGALAGESIKKYSFSSSNIDQILLSLSVIGSRLDAYISHNPTVNETNYVWTTELSPANPSTVLAMKKSEYEEFLRKQDPSKRKGVWNGQKEIPSENNTFYIVFKNPFYSSVNYSFTVGAKDSSTVMKHGYKHPLTISPNGGVGSLLYYSADEEEILKIIIEFTVERTVSAGPDSEFDRYLKKGLPLNVYYWSDKSTAGLGSQVSLLKDYVMMDSVSELPSDHGKRRYKIREAFTTISRRGKFQFEIENPFSVAADVQVTAYSTEYGSLSLGQNSQFSNSLSKGMSETFEVYLTSKGQWYFFVQACSGNVDFSLGDNPENLATGSSNTIEITQETNAIKQIEIKEAGMRYVRIGRSESSRADNAQFTLSSSFFADDPKQYNYELRSSAPNFQTKYIFGPHNSILTVDIPAINVMDAAENDEIIYRVKACPERADEPDAATNVCRMYEECKTAEIQRKLSSNEGFRASVERLLPGKYYVQVTAEIQHKGKMVRFVPYPVQYLTIEKSITNKLSEALGTILLALGILAISGIICYKCYGKFKKVTEDRGFELPSFGGKRKEYGFLGDDL